MPAKIAPAAVGSYPAFSPLPLARRFVFCCTVRTRALRRAPRPFGRNPALWCPDFPPADKPRANARPKFSKNSPFRYRRIRDFRKPRPILAEIKGLRIRIASAIAREAKNSSGLQKRNFAVPGEQRRNFRAAQIRRRFKTEKTQKKSGRQSRPRKENSRAIAECNGEAKPRPTPPRLSPVAGAAGEKAVFSLYASRKFRAPRVSRERAMENQTLPRPTFGIGLCRALLSDSREENFGSGDPRVFKARRPLDIALVPVCPGLTEKR